MAEALVAIIIAGVSAVIGTIVWLVRLEGRVNAVVKDNDRTQKDVDELRIKHETLDSNLVKELTAIKVTLAKIEGYLSTRGDHGT